MLIRDPPFALMTTKRLIKKSVEYITKIIKQNEMWILNTSSLWFKHEHWCLFSLKLILFYHVYDYVVLLKCYNYRIQMSEMIIVHVCIILIKWEKMVTC